MVSVGMGQDDVCTALGLSLPTVLKYYRRVIDLAHNRLVVRMRVALVAKADAGDVPSLLHVNKVFGWNERLVVVDGGVEVDPRTLSDAAIASRLAKFDKSRRSPAALRAAKSTGAPH